MLSSSRRTAVRASGDAEPAGHDVAAVIHVRVFHRVVPAAGVGAHALVGVAVVEVAGEQTAPGVGDAQRAVHEHLQFDVGAGLADLPDLLQGEFAREDDAPYPLRLPEAHAGVVHGVGLHRQVDGHIGPALAHQQDQAGIGHDQGIRTQSR